MRPCQIEIDVHGGHVYVLIKKAEQNGWRTLLLNHEEAALLAEDLRKELEPLAPLLVAEAEK